MKGDENNNSEVSEVIESPVEFEEQKGGDVVATEKIEREGSTSSEEIEVIEVPFEEVVERVESENRALYEQLLEKNDGSPKKAIFEFCFLKNIGYIGKIVNRLLKTPGPVDMPNAYLKEKGESKFADTTFFEQIRQENFEKIYSEDYAISILDEEDKKNRLQVIEILGYDPFADDKPEDQPQLYRDMTGMITESMRKDVAKARAALSIVRTYSNIDKYQKRINEITRSGAIDEETQKQLDQYIKIQKTMQDSINATAEKNNFTVKGIGTSGRGMLSDVMNQVNDYGIDEGIVNFYDIATSKSIEEVANISFKAQLNQVNLSKTDYADILAEQARIVKECQSKAKDALEALRLTKEKIVKQELLDELAEDYRKKGIKEDEIQEFINREFKMYEIES